MYDLGNWFHFDMNMAKSNPASIIRGEKFRFTILSERLVRIEYNFNGNFVDNPTQLALCRNFPVTKFEINQDSKYLEIYTKYFKLSYTKDAPITASSLKVQLRNTDGIWYYGYPEVKTYDGVLNSLDLGKESYHKGIYSPDGFSAVDDSNTLMMDSNGNYLKRPADGVDIYIFMYGDDFDLALKDYLSLTGKPQLIPRYSFGNWWSKNYTYKTDEINYLFHKFNKEVIPISVFLLDNPWHIRNGNSNTGYTFDKSNINDPVSMIKSMHDIGIRVGVNINPTDGVFPNEEVYNAVIQYIKVPANTKVAFAPLNLQFVAVFLRMILEPLENNGIDFYWLDYNNVGLEHYLINHYMYLDSGRKENKRNMLISRPSLIAPHRYGVLYSGRSNVSYDLLKQVPYINTSASNLGVSWWSTDVGGFMGGTENSELYLRCIELGCFSPILRISVDGGRYYKREPWRWDVTTSSIVKEYMQLRNRLVPYIYSCGYKYVSESIPLVNPIYHKQKELFYDTYYKNEYMFGSELLVSPIISQKDSLMNRVIHKTYLPEGIWYDFKSGKRYPGGRSYVSFFKDEEYPVYARSGAIIPMAINLDNSCSLPTDLEINVFPKSSNTFVLYEDDGVTNLYKSGYYLKTLIDYNYQENNYTLIIRAVEGKSGIVPDTRNYRIRFKNTQYTEEVVANFDSESIPVNYYVDDNDFIVEVMNVKTIGQLSINCKSKAMENDSIRLINEDINGIISDLEVETWLKDKIAGILFSNLPIKKKRIEVRKLKKDKLDPKFIKMFLRLLEYVEQI